MPLFQNFIGGAWWWYVADFSIRAMNGEIKIGENSVNTLLL